MCFSDNTIRSKWKLKEDGTSVAPPQCLRSAQSTAPLILPVSTRKQVENRANKKKANEKSEVTNEIEKDEENDKDEDSVEDDDSTIHTLVNNNNTLQKKSLNSLVGWVP